MSLRDVAAATRVSPEYEDVVLVVYPERVVCSPYSGVCSPYSGVC